MNNIFILKLKRLVCKILKGDEYVAKHQTIDIVKALGVKIGSGCRIYSTSFSTEPFLIEIGDHVTITNNVRFITHDGGVWVFRNENPNIELFGKIKIGNNVFIGLNSIILFNTEIGDNTIVAAGSVVKGKIEKNSVIGGVPARIITTIEEYFNKNIPNFTYYKSLTPEQKKQAILSHLKSQDLK
jgi:acetyltransferase-like isoleucine patch superfamily enzyme